MSARLETARRTAAALLPDHRLIGAEARPMPDSGAQVRLFTRTGWWRLVQAPARGPVRVDPHWFGPKAEPGQPTDGAALRWWVTDDLSAARADGTLPADVVIKVSHRPGENGQPVLLATVVCPPPVYQEQPGTRTGGRPRLTPQAATLRQQVMAILDAYGWDHCETMARRYRSRVLLVHDL